ncbi:MAG: ECF transporter S component [Clostridia bacterium]|nr:ECF transporter S component [Clostridia bacterium]
MKTNKRINYLVKIAILSTIAFVIMLFEVPLPFIAPAFYEMNFSPVISLIGSFSLGPAAGIWIELLKNVLKVIIKGSSTAYVGDFSNFVTGCTLVLPAALIYLRHKDKKHAIIGMIVGTITLGIVGGLVNYYIMVPMYVSLYHMPLEKILEMAQAIFPSIDSLWKMILMCVVPFNLIRGVLCSVITFLLYKRIAIILKK